MPLPKLKNFNRLHWCECVKRLMLKTKTVAVFLVDSPINETIIMGSSCWTNKLKENAPHIDTAPQDTPFQILNTITMMACARGRQIS